MSEESVEPMPETGQPEEAREEAVSVEEVAEAAGVPAASEAAASQPKAPREPLSPQNRWAIFGVAIAVCVIVGVAAPLARAMTDETSIMNPSHGVLLSEKEKSSSSSASASNASSSADASDASSAASSASSSSAATSGNPSNGEYLLPDRATKLYTAEELAGLTDYELYLARNEAYALHGRKFKNDDLTQYFSGKSWYVPTYEPADFDAMPTPLNDTERANVDLIRQLEAQRNSPYAV